MTAKNGESGGPEHLPAGIFFDEVTGTIGGHLASGHRQEVIREEEDDEEPEPARTADDSLRGGDLDAPAAAGGHELGKRPRKNSTVSTVSKTSRAKEVKSAKASKLSYSLSVRVTAYNEHGDSPLNIILEVCPQKALQACAYFASEKEECEKGLLKIGDRVHIKMPKLYLHAAADPLKPLQERLTANYERRRATCGRETSMLGDSLERGGQRCTAMVYSNECNNVIVQHLREKRGFGQGPYAQNSARNELIGWDASVLRESTYDIFEDPRQRVEFKLVDGELPRGLHLDKTTGCIFGAIQEPYPKAKVAVVAKTIWGKCKRGSCGT